MKERPVLFSGAMVRAILDGRKTQTRRLAQWPRAATMHGRTPTPEWSRADGHRADQYFHAAYGGGDLGDEVVSLRVGCPYGSPGDLLYVREAWCTPPDLDGVKPSDLGQEWTDTPRGTRMATTICYAADYPSWEPWLRTKWRPGIFLPRWASRLILEVTSVRVERLHDITEEDARAEGVDITPPHLMHGHLASMSARENFEVLWDKINRERAAWHLNPWVWVVSFRRVEGAKGVSAA